MKINHLQHKLLAIVGAEVKLILLLTHENSISHELILALDYLFNDQFSKIYNNSDLREQATVLISPHFDQKIYLSAFINQDIPILRKQMKNIFSLTQLTENGHVVILHDKHYTANDLDSSLKKYKTTWLHFDQEMEIE